MSIKYQFFTSVMRPYQGLWGTGEKGYLFQGNRGTRSNFEGNGGEDNIGAGNIRKQIFEFWGTGEQAYLFQGNKGTGTPWEGLCDNFITHVSI